MRANTRLTKDISDMLKIEHWAAQKLISTKPRSVRGFLWGFVYAISRQEKERMILADGEKIAANITKKYGARQTHS